MKFSKNGLFTEGVLLSFIKGILNIEQGMSNIEVAGRAK